MVTLTFIRAFESLPVHCLNSRPSGNHRSLRKGRAAAILFVEHAKYPLIAHVNKITHHQSMSANIWAASEAG
jgi:hypothetical protein